MSFVNLDCENLLQRISYCQFLLSREIGLGGEGGTWGDGLIAPNMLHAVAPGCTYAWDSQHMAQGLPVARLAAVSGIF